MAFTPAYVPLTELDAVNQMLASIGQSPVSTVQVAAANIKDVEIARMTLHNTVRELCSKSWFFNTDSEYPLITDVNGEIAIPVDALETVLARRSWPREFTERANKVYDGETHSHDLAAEGTTFYFNILRFLPFTSLPQVARQYASRRAGRIFQAGAVGAQILFSFDLQMEQEAHALLTAAELRARPQNLLHGSLRTSMIAGRRFGPVR